MSLIQRQAMFVRHCEAGLGVYLRHPRFPAKLMQDRREKESVRQSGRLCQFPCEAQAFRDSIQSPIGLSKKPQHPRRMGLTGNSRVLRETGYIFPMAFQAVLRHCFVEVIHGWNKLAEGDESDFNRN